MSAYVGISSVSSSKHLSISSRPVRNIRMSPVPCCGWWVKGIEQEDLKTHMQVNIPCNFNRLPHIVWSRLLKVRNLNGKHPSFQTNNSGFVWMCPRSEVFQE
jgi:hypothetical protein